MSRKRLRRRQRHGCETGIDAQIIRQRLRSREDVVVVEPGHAFAHPHLLFPVFELWKISAGFLPAASPARAKAHTAGLPAAPQLRMNKDDFGFRIRFHRSPSTGLRILCTPANAGMQTGR